MVYLDRFIEFLDSLPDLLVYFMLGVSAFMENIFPPAPGDTITAFGAFLVGTGRLGFTGMFIATTLGSLSGFMALFWAGQWLGRRYFIERDFRFFKAADIIRTEEWFRKYGYVLILLNRFLPGVRSVISVAGGISKLRVARVAWLALISCSVWNLIWISIGYTLGSNWQEAKGRIGDILANYNLAILFLAGIVILFIILRKVLKRS
ncbi:MAG: hypothetical protein DRH50_06825 [Deltaproteobacteria bacterium]|nr:MAG: hypothetical protein DRH50_06825 [Deltaproteobacteria bacterium]